MGTESSQTAAPTSRTHTVHSDDNAWLDVLNPDRQAFTKLEADYQLHPVHLYESVQKVLHTQVEREEHYVFLVLHLPLYDAATDHIYSQQLGVFVGRHFLITIHNGDGLVLSQLLETMQHHETKRAEYFRKGPGSLLYELIRLLLEDLSQISDGVLAELDAIEGDVFDNSSSDAERIGKVRQHIVRLRRIIAPLKLVLEDLTQQINDFSGQSLARQYATNAKTAGKLWEVVEEAKETVEIYKDADFTANTEQTNRILAILTLVFTFTIPVTVVGTLYGMNVFVPGGLEAGSWTFMGRYTTFIIMIAAGSAIAVGMYLYFKRKKWF